MISQNEIREPPDQARQIGCPDCFPGSNVDKAIKACGLGAEKSPVRAKVSEFLSGGFCMAPVDVRSLCPIGEFEMTPLQLISTGQPGKVKNIQVYLDTGKFWPATSYFLCQY